MTAPFEYLLLLQFITAADITPVYFAVMIATGFMFIVDVKIPKPGLRGILALIGVVVIEFIVFIIALFMFR